MVAALLLVLAAVTLFPQKTSAAPLSDDKIVLGGDFLLGKGQSIHGNLIILGGAVVLDDGSRIDGDVLIFGGTADIKGEVEGNIFMFNGALDLEKGARLEGDLNLYGGAFSLDDEVFVFGEIRTNEEALLADSETKSPSNRLLAWIWDGIWSLFLVFATSAFAVMIVMLWPEKSQRVARTIVDQPILSGGVGLGALFVVVPIFLLLGITIILAPIGLVGSFFLVLMGLFGWVSLGYEIGYRFSQMIRSSWAPGVSAGMGTLALSFVALSLKSIPCIGPVIGFSIPLIGLGAVLLTQFGTCEYPNDL